MSDVFEAWCQDARSLTYGEFLDELYGKWEAWCREVAPGFLDDRWREGTEPQTPAEQTYFDIYHQCRIRLHAAEWFAVCFLDIDRHEEHVRKFGGTTEDVVAVLSAIVDQLILDRSVEGFVARVGKVRFILIVPAARLGEVCSQILECFDKHFYRPTRTIVGGFGIPNIRAIMGVVTNQHRHFTHFSQIAEVAIEMLGYAKTQQGSVFVLDRRTEA
jgi:GGDEF domain-containing protein